MSKREYKKLPIPAIEVGKLAEESTKMVVRVCDGVCEGSTFIAKMPEGELSIRVDWNPKREQSA